MRRASQLGPGVSWGAVVLGLVLAGGCSEEPRSEVQPVQVAPREGGRSPRAPVAEEPSPYVVQPHLRRQAHDDDRGGSRDGAGGSGASGGGGGAGGGFGSRLEDWEPRHSPDPSEREVEAFRRRLESQMAARLDPEDDPCDQLLGMARAGLESGRQPGEPQGDAPDRAALRRDCRQFPESFRQCLDRAYFREHLDECRAQMDRMARRGRHLTREAREAREEAERTGDPPFGP
ncbi:MAG TPA: hypothetical protein RMH99_18665 [Sandaracinaceae bacterium LLY-WYZ-13_1]|nr:hypothetical protein [Sandaracinaceae bacterium LLY-WYZ-13_1]